MNIRAMGCRGVHGETDGEKCMTKLKVAVRNYAKEPKKERCI